jgi:hypothetical protein
MTTATKLQLARIVVINETIDEIQKQRDKAINEITNESFDDDYEAFKKAYKEVEDQVYFTETDQPADRDKIAFQDNPEGAYRYLRIEKGMEHKAAMEEMTRYPLYYGLTQLRDDITSLNQ